MITNTDKKLCCGCSACVQICPKQCIGFDEDNEGFCYPIVNQELCIGCGLCEKVCPILNPEQPREPLKVDAAINTNEVIRLTSSSGGIFSILAEVVINKGGVVFGAHFDKNWEVKHGYTESIEGIEAFRGSKYVQSRIGDTYKQAHDFLSSGRIVLYTGTPCQIAGLKHYLRKDYENLFTVDFVCHGVPSPLVWRKYIKEINHNINGQIRNVSFRDKTSGWNNFGIKLSYDDREVKEPFSQNIFMQAFLHDLILRPSCHSCNFKNNRSYSDITIADFWGVEKICPEINDNKGLSLVLYNTDKFQNVFELVGMLTWQMKISEVLKYNSAFKHSSTPNTKRSFFFNRLNNKNSVIKLIKEALRPSFFVRMKNQIRLYKRLVFSIIKLNDK